jgi:hypothetical protein
MPSVITTDRRQQEGSEPPSGGQGKEQRKGEGVRRERGKKFPQIRTLRKKSPTLRSRKRQTPHIRWRCSFVSSPSDGCRCTARTGRNGAASPLGFSPLRARAPPVKGADPEAARWCRATSHVGTGEGPRGSATSRLRCRATAVAGC